MCDLFKLCLGEKVKPLVCVCFSQIHFVLLVSRQGKVRLTKWYSPYTQKERSKVSESTELLLRTFFKKILKHWEHDVLCRLYVSSVEWFWTEVPSSATLSSGGVTKSSTKDTRASTSVCVLMRRITSWRSLRSFITTLRSSTAISEVWVS